MRALLSEDTTLDVLQSIGYRGVPSKENLSTRDKIIRYLVCAKLIICIYLWQRNAVLYWIVPPFTSCLIQVKSFLCYFCHMPINGMCSLSTSYIQNLSSLQMFSFFPKSRISSIFLSPTHIISHWTKWTAHHCSILLSTTLQQVVDFLPFI